MPDPKQQEAFLLALVSVARGEKCDASVVVSDAVQLAALAAVAELRANYEELFRSLQQLGPHL